MMFPKYTAICPQGVYQLVTEVSKKQTDTFGRMRIGDLARQMQTITEQHLNQSLGISIDELNASGKSWVIAWTQMNIIRLPECGEKILLRIWQGKNKAVMYSRKYAFYTMTGEPLVTTSSLFLLMDRDTRGMAVPPDQMKTIQPAKIEGEPDHPKMRMVFPSEYRNKVQRVVMPKEIDFNGHLNNSHYLDWVEEILDESYTRDHQPKSVWVQYSKELMEGQEVHLRFEWKGDTMYLCGSERETEAFLLQISF